MAFLISLGEPAHQAAQQQYNERRIPGVLAGISSSVAHVLLERCEDRDRVVAGIRAIEARREIQKEHQYERVMRSLAGRQEIREAMEAAPERLGMALREGRLNETVLLPEERPVVARLLVAGAPDLESAFRNRDFLDTNEHAVLHNLFRRTALHELQARAEAGRAARRGRDDREDRDENAEDN